MKLNSKKYLKDNKNVFFTTINSIKHNYLKLHLLDYKRLLKMSFFYSKQNKRILIIDNCSDLKKQLKFKKNVTFYNSDSADFLKLSDEINKHNFIIIFSNKNIKLIDRIISFTKLIKKPTTLVLFNNAKLNFKKNYTDYLIMIEAKNNETTIKKLKFLLNSVL